MNGPVCPYCSKDIDDVKRLTISSMDDTVITYCPHSDCRKVLGVQVQPISDDIPTVDQMVASAFQQ